MNYRHAFHAGNFADCLKHAVLRKPAPFFVLDTHAGVGRYDLSGGPAERTGEWRAGIGRLIDDPPEALRPFVETVRALGLYPGSPLLIRSKLRAHDRLATCELHPEDVLDLRRLFARDPQVAVHHRDGWEAIAGLLPPKERRGLVLIDPPYEGENELAAVVAALRTATARFPAGTLAAWYPIKHRAPVRHFHAAVRESGIRDVVAVELFLREPIDPTRLNGCGLLVVNPPFRFEAEIRPVVAALRARLGAETMAVLRLCDE